MKHILQSSFISLICLAFACQSPKNSVEAASFQNWNKVHIYDQGILTIKHSGKFTLLDWKGDSKEGDLGLQILDYYVTERGDLIVLTESNLVMINQFPKTIVHKVIAEFPKGTRYLNILGNASQDYICLMRPGIAVDWWHNGKIVSKMDYKGLFCGDDNKFKLPIFYYSDRIGSSLYIVTSSSLNQTCYHFWDLKDNKWVSMPVLGSPDYIPLAINKGGQEVIALTLNKTRNILQVNQLMLNSNEIVDHNISKLFQEVSPNVYAVITRDNEDSTNGQHVCTFNLSLLDLSGNKTVFSTEVDGRYYMYFKYPKIYLWKNDWQSFEEKTLEYDLKQYLSVKDKEK